MKRTSAKELRGRWTTICPFRPSVGRSISLLVGLAKKARLRSSEETDSARIAWRWLRGGGRSFLRVPFCYLVRGSCFPYPRCPVRAAGRDTTSVRRKRRGEDPALVALKGEQF